MEVYYRSLRDSIRKSKIFTRLVETRSPGVNDDINYKVWSLLESSFYGEKKTVKRLVEEEDVDLNAIDSDGNTAVHKAVTGNRSKVLKVLLEKGAICNKINNDFDTPLMIAIEKQLCDCVQILIEYDNNVNGKLVNGMNPLLIALIKHSTQKKLLENETFTSNDENNENLIIIIHLIIDALKTEFAFERLEYYKCLFFSVSHRINFAFEALINKAPNLLSLVSTDAEGHEETHRYLRHKLHPLHIAAFNGDNQMIETLLNVAKVDVNIESNTKWTALHFAVDNCHPSTIELLISKTANCNALNRFKETPLHIAIRKISFLVDDHKDRLKGEYIKGIYDTLLPADEYDELRLATALYLVKIANADLFARSKFGKTPLDLINCVDKEERFKVQSMFSKLIEERQKSTEELKLKIKQLNEAKKDLESKFTCQICMDKHKEVVFQCGHGSCGVCVEKLVKCHICREDLGAIVKLY